MRSPSRTITHKGGGGGEKLRERGPDHSEQSCSCVSFLMNHEQCKSVFQVACPLSVSPCSLALTTAAHHLARSAGPGASPTLPVPLQRLHKTDLMGLMLLNAAEYMRAKQDLNRRLADAMSKPPIKELYQAYKFLTALPKPTVDKLYEKLTPLVVEPQAPVVESMSEVSPNRNNFHTQTPVRSCDL